MVVWIEIYIDNRERLLYTVTTCVVVWIEILYARGVRAGSMSPPAWWCGLKSMCMALMSIVCKSPPAWWCGLKLLCCPVGLPARCHHLRGGVD